MSLKLTLLAIMLSFSAELISQIKLVRPSAAVGIKIVDSMVARSFNMYERIFDYHTRISEGGSLSEKDLCAIEDVFYKSEILLSDALAASEVLRKESLFIRAKGTIQLERAKRAVYYCKEASTEMLLAPKSPYGELSRN